jgi:hypothetical protein
VADPELKVKIKLDGINQFKSGLKAFNNQLNNTRASFAKLGAAVKNSALIFAAFAAAAVAAGTAVFNLTKSNAEFNDNIAKGAQQLGVSTKFLQEYGFALEQLGGDQQQFQKGLGVFAKTIGELRVRGKGLADTMFKDVDPAFLKLLKSTTNVEDAFTLVINKIRLANTEQEKIAIASTFFGTRAGRAIAQFARQSNGELEALIQQVRRFGGVLSDDALKQSEEFIDAQNRLRVALRATSRRITSEFEPAFIALFDGLTERVVELQPKLIALTQELTAKALPLIADFLQLIVGEKGLEQVDARVAAVFTNLVNLKDTVVGAVKAISAAFQAFFVVLEPIGAIFGLSGQQAGLTLLFLQFTGVLKIVGAALVALGSTFKLFFVTLGLGKPALALLTGGFTKFVLFVRTQVLAVIVSSWLAGFATMGTATTALAGAFAVVKAAAVAAWAVVTGPIGLIVAGVALIGGGLALLIEKTIGWKNIWTAVVDTVKGFFSIIANLPGAIALIGKLLFEWTKFFGPILFEEFKAAIGKIIAVAIPLLFSAFEALVQSLGPLIENIAMFFKTAFDNVINLIGDGFKVLFDALVRAATSILDRIKNLFGSTIDAVKRAAAAASGAVSGRRSTQTSSSIVVNRDVIRRATGGLIRGPGSGTSDSIPMLGSNGEFMMRAASVRKYGVGFMEAVNKGTLKLKKFAQGGLIGDLSGPALAPASVNMASSGSTGRPLQLQMPGGGQINATVPERTARGLERDLRRADFAKIGRLPRYYE